MTPTASPKPIDLRAWLELFRLPQLFTVAADPLAGALLVGAGWSDSRSIIFLMLASAAIWAGGCAISDWLRLADDRIRRPLRPLPSKRIPRWQAVVFGMALLAAGVTLADSPARTCTSIALLLIVLLALSRVILKDVPAAYLLDGAYRSFNLLLGMSLIPAAASTTHLGLRIYLMTALGLYCLGLVLLEEADVHRYRAPRLAAIGAVPVAAALSIVALPAIFITAGVSLLGTAWAALLLGVIGYRLMQTVITPNGTSVLKLIETLSLGAVLLNAAAVAYLASPWASLAVVWLLGPAAWSIWFLRPQPANQPQT